MVVGEDVPLRFDCLRHPADPRMDALLTLYGAAIPAHERKPEADIRRLAGTDRSRIEMAFAGDATAGFTIAYAGPEVALLEYMAVDGARRSSGIGGELFRRLVSSLHERPLLVEVESDRLQSNDLEQRRRRLNFYRRLGCRRVEGIHYILPLNAAAEAEAMDLLITGQVGERLARADLKRWLQDIYADVYGCEASDARIDRMLAGAADTVRLA